jgi:hypothetical protein
MPRDRGKATKIARKNVTGAALETVARRAETTDELTVARALAWNRVAAVVRPQPIATAPASAHYDLLLYCPEQGGWYTGEWLGGTWLSAMDAEQELRPTHWIIAPPPPTREQPSPFEAGGYQADDNSVERSTWIELSSPFTPTRPLSR